MINRKSLTSAIAASTLVSLIGLAYAQTNGNPDGSNSGPTVTTTPGQVDSSQPSTMQESTPSSTSPSSTMDSSTTDSSTTAAPASGEPTTNSADSADSELAPQADRG